MTSLTPDQAAAQRLRGINHGERVVVVRATSEVIQASHAPTGDAAVDRALQQSGREVGELLADLNDAQRDAERHDGDMRDGDELLAAYLDALRARRSAAVEAGERHERGTRERGNHMRRANAYVWAINRLKAEVRPELERLRGEIAKELKDL